LESWGVLQMVKITTGYDYWSYGGCIEISICERADTPCCHDIVTDEMFEWGFGLVDITIHNIDNKRCK
jgi:hypothetical protein